MSDWSYVTLAYLVAWGGVTAYAVALARRVIAARRLEQRLRAALDMEARTAVEEPERRAGGNSTASGWTAEGE